MISTSLYFVVFGSAIGSRMAEIDGVSYGAFIVPGLIMLSLLTESISNASFGIYMPQVGRHDLRAAVGAGLVRRDRASATSARRRPSRCILGLDHPGHGAAVRAVRDRASRSGWSASWCSPSVTFSLFGFIIGIWADGFEKLQIVPMLIVTPLTFLGGSFYSIDMLPPFWQKVTLFNPVVYLISGFRWSFYGIVGRERRRQPRHDARCSWPLCLVAIVVDLQDRLPAEGVSGFPVKFCREPFDHRFEVTLDDRRADSPRRRWRNHLVVRLRKGLDGQVALTRSGK